MPNPPSARPAVSPVHRPGDGPRRTPEQRRAAAAKAKRNNVIFGVIGVVLICGVIIGAIVLFVIRPGQQQAGLPAISSQPSASVTPSASATPTPTAAEPTDEASDEETEAGTPTAKPSSTKEQDTARPLEKNNLPTVEDLHWWRDAVWLEDSSTEGLGEGALSNCVSNENAAGLAAEGVLRRDFTLPDTGYATAVAMNFDTPAAASKAFASLNQLVEGCATTLSPDDFADIRPVQAYPVDLPQGIDGRFFRTSYTLAQQDPAYETTGVALAGNRLILLSMVVVVDDDLFTYDPKNATDAKPLHPMFKSLTESAERLTR